MTNADVVGSHSECDSTVLICQPCAPSEASGDEAPEPLDQEQSDQDVESGSREERLRREAISAQHLLTPPEESVLPGLSGWEACEGSPPP